jgi:CPA2 family monovalent cation:H+ antiporter-2
VKAGAQLILEALAKQTASDEPEHALDQVRALVPGIGEPVPVALGDASPAIGQTLAQLDLRGLTGASVLAISRPDGGVSIPTAHEALRAGDVLALAGTREAIDAARALLHQRAASPAPSESTSRVRSTPSITR